MHIPLLTLRVSFPVLSFTDVVGKYRQPRIERNNFKTEDCNEDDHDKRTENSARQK